jgi:outer membrane lipoprotein-sorting protein
MRTIGGIAVILVCFVVPGALQAGERDKALAVIEQAIKAHGGADALNKAQKRSRSGQGVVTLGGETRITTEETLQLPDRCKVVFHIERARVILVLNGDKGWMQAGGATQEMTKESLKERREELYIWWLMNLTPLLKDEFELTPLADAKVGDREAAVVKVARKDYPDVRLFFDKKTGLLVKIARRSTESGLTIPKEYTYSEHKEFDGVKMPTKEVITFNGNTKMSEVQFRNYKVLSDIDAKTFDKP